MIRILILRANKESRFDDAPENCKELRNIHESAAIWQAIKFAQGRAYRIEFYGDGDTPFRTLEQLALPSGRFEIVPGLERPKEIR